MLPIPPSAALAISLAISTLAFAQNEGRPRKVLTPEQEAYQQSWKAWFKDHKSLQERAKEIYEAEMDREKTGDCSAAHSTREFMDCYEKVLGTSETSLRDFESTLLALMAAPPGVLDQSGTAQTGPAGPILNPSQLSAEFEQLEKVWRGYRETACTAAFHQFGGGTGGPPFESECRIKLTRNHLRELDLIYDGDLRR